MSKLNRNYSEICFYASDENGDAAQALLRLVERCFNLVNEPDSKDGITMSSPLTFLRIVRQIQPLVRGGGKADSSVALV